MTRLFNGLKRSKLVDLQAWECDIAAQCAAAVRSQMGPECAAMSAAELRGYARALALPQVRSSIQRSHGGARIPFPDEDAIIRSTLDRTVQTILRDVQTPPVVSLPQPHVRRRSAA